MHLLGRNPNRHMPADCGVSHRAVDFRAGPKILSIIRLSGAPSF